MGPLSQETARALEELVPGKGRGRRGSGPDLLRRPAGALPGRWFPGALLGGAIRLRRAESLPCTVQEKVERNSVMLTKIRSMLWGAGCLLFLTPLLPLPLLELLLHQSVFGSLLMKNFT